MKSAFYLSALGLLLSTTALAQSRWSIGPQVSLVGSTANFKKFGTPFNTTYRAGIEAGIQASIPFGHFALQPALLYSQLGYNIDNTRSFPTNINPYTYYVDERYRFYYLTFATQAAYRLHSNGAGWQVFIGPYAAKLLGGYCSANDKNEWASGVGTLHVENAPIEPESKRSSRSYLASSDTYYMPGFDAGVQAGVGYRLGPLLAQLSYSLGLVNLGSDYSSFIERTDFYNRAFRLSASYQFGPK